MFDELLETVNAYLSRDPAAKGPFEVLFLYPAAIRSHAFLLLIPAPI